MMRSWTRHCASPRRRASRGASIARAPLVERIAVGTIWWRIHWQEHLPVLFGPGARGSPRHRFDAPGGEYRVAYLGMTREPSFAEVLLREPDMEYVTMRGVRSRRVTQIRVCRAVTLLALHGPGLARAGVTATATAGDDDPRSREVARSIWARPEHLDGLTYRARHDDGELSVALFDRASDAIEVVGSAALDDDPRWLASMASRYGFDFIP
jgi:hypothetical protein